MSTEFCSLYPFFIQCPQTHLGEIRANQQDRQPGIVGINMEGKLYQQPNMVRQSANLYIIFVCYCLLIFAIAPNNNLPLIKSLMIDNFL